MRANKGNGGPDLGPEPQPAVFCRGVTKEFGAGATRVQALRGIDLEIAFGQMTLLVGPSGCGKTTLLSVVAGILDPTAGAVTVLGQDLKLLGRQKVGFRGRNIGFVFQQFNLLPPLTAAENAAVPLLIAGMRRRVAVGRAAELLKQMGMAHRLGAFPTQLSGGEQQRVAIARALVHEPRLVVCDEPTSALDAQTGAAIMQLLRDRAVYPERAVLVVTHDSRAFPYADRIVTMNDGRIEKESPH
jgi:putative ABC transport system ATP-binding protein